MRDGLKGFIQRFLAKRGYAIVNRARLFHLEETAQWHATIEQAMARLGAIQQHVTTLSEEVSETKSGVSALQGDSGDILSHVVVLRQEQKLTESALQQHVTALLKEVAETKGGVSALQGESGETLSHIIALRNELASMADAVRHEFAGMADAIRHESAGMAAAAERLLAPGGGGDARGTAGGASGASSGIREIRPLPAKLDTVASECFRQVEKDHSQTLGPHYRQMANLVAQHWVREGQLPGDPDPADDFTLKYARLIDANTRDATEPDPAKPLLPWRHFWGDPDCAVFLVLGEANAANSGEGRYVTRNEVYSLDVLRMNCTRADDPLAPASGDGGSIWGRLGDRLIENGLCRRVLFVPLAFGGSSITDWVPDGQLHRRTKLALGRLRKELFSPIVPFSAVLWMQGESEASSTRMSARAYGLHFRDIVADLRANGVFAPVFPAVTTRCEVAGQRQRNGAAIREAHRSLPNAVAGVFAGPDTDTVEPELRYDGCHFSTAGLDRCADLWLHTLSSCWPLLTKLSLE